MSDFHSTKLSADVSTKSKLNDGSVIMDYSTEEAKALTMPITSAAIVIYTIRNRC